MRFPYKRSVGQDLRDLFQVQRVQTQARDLGHSSIRQGEGAIRLLGTDGTTVHAVLGDLPGGGYGLGVLSGGSILTVPQIVSGATGPLGTRIGTLETFKTYADAQITNLNTTTGNLVAANTASNSRLNSLEAFKTYADNQITDLLSNRTWQDNQITNINTNLGTLNSFRSYADGQITNLNSSVGSLGTSVGAVAGRATSLESRANSLEFRMFQAEQRNGEQQDEINELRRRINSAGIPP